MTELDDLIARLEIAPTIHLPEVTMATATTLRQILVDRAEAATALRALKGERDRARQQLTACDGWTINAMGRRAEAAETSLAAQRALVEAAGNVLRNVVNFIESGNLQMNSPNIEGDERDGRDSPYPWHDEWIGYVRSFLSKLPGKETTP